MWMPDAAASAGSRSDAESVKIATRLKVAPPPVTEAERVAFAGMIRARSSPQPVPCARMDRSLWAVLAGTFTLRFSTGLTGAMLGVYLATLHRARWPGRRARSSPGVFGALFYLAELVLSPVFGILSDRQGHHRVMLYGPVFGAVAVIMTGFTADLGLPPPLAPSSRRSPAAWSSWA